MDPSSFIVGVFVGTYFGIVIMAIFSHKGDDDK